MFFASYETFLKNKDMSWASLSALFSAWLLKENNYYVIFYQWTKIHGRIISWDIG